MYTNNTILVFNIVYIFEFTFKLTLTSLFILFLFIKTHIIYHVQILFSDYALNLLFSWRRILSTACWTVALSSCFQFNIIFFVGSWLRYLVSLLLEYLKPKSPSTLHSSEECPGIWMIQVSLDLSFGWSTYIFTWFPVLSLISE